MLLNTLAFIMPGFAMQNKYVKCSEWQRMMTSERENACTKIGANELKRWLWLLASYSQFAICALHAKVRAPLPLLCLFVDRWTEVFENLAWQWRDTIVIILSICFNAQTRLSVNLARHIKRINNFQDVQLAGTFILGDFLVVGKSITYEF